MSYITKTYLETQFKNFASKLKDIFTTKEDFNDLEIGGRNLFLGTALNNPSLVANNSTDWTKPVRYYNGNASMHSFSEYADGVYVDEITMDSAVANYGIAFARKAESIMNVGDTYTISVWAKCTSTARAFYIGLSYYTTDGNWIWRGGANQTAIKKANEWQKFTLTFKLTDTNVNYICYTVGFASDSGTACTGYIRQPKLEKGNKATDWTPAPEDTEEKITELNTKYTEVKQTADGLSTTVASHTTQLKSVENQVTTNLLKPTLATTTRNGITCTNNGDGTYTLNGTATSLFADTFGYYSIDEGKPYKLLCCPSEGSVSTYYADWRNDSDGQIFEFGDGSVYTSKTGQSNKAVRVIVNKGFTCDNLVFKPMLTTNLNATYDDFVPYTGNTGQLNSDVAEVQIALDSKAESSHTHSNYAQNAFSKVYCGGKEALIEAGTKNDSLTINPGNNISIMTDSVNKSFTISATDTNTDTKVTNTLAKTTKAYVTGTTSSTTNTGTQVFDTGVYLGTKAGTLYINEDAYVSGYSVEATILNHVRVYELVIGNVTIDSSSPWSMNLESTINSLGGTKDGFYGACLKKCWPHSTWAFSCTLLVNGTNVYIATTTKQVYDVSILIFYNPYF